MRGKGRRKRVLDGGIDEFPLHFGLFCRRGVLQGGCLSLLSFVFFKKLEIRGFCSCMLLYRSFLPGKWEDVPGRGELYLLSFFIGWMEGLGVTISRTFASQGWIWQQDDCLDSGTWDS